MNHFVEENLKSHDLYQFEIKSVYPFDREHNCSDFIIESYIFLPHNLGVSAATYSRDDIYHDMQKYIRLQTPNIILKKFINSEQSPIIKLENILIELVKNPHDKKIQEQFQKSVKLVGSIFKSTLRNEGHFVQNLTNSDNPIAYIEKQLQDIVQVRTNFIALRKYFTGQNQLKDDFVALYNFADEYMSLIVERHTVLLLKTLRELNNEGDSNIMTMLNTLVENEWHHRKEQKYKSLQKENSGNESYLYRFSTLKKVMESVLFIKSQTKTEGVLLLRHLVPILSATLAMLIATLMLFFVQKNVENFSIVFLVFLVTIYVVKDRSKEWFNNLIVHKGRRFLYDYKTILYTNLNKKIGFLRESVKFINTKQLSEDIAKLRNNKSPFKLSTNLVGENILYTKKEVMFFAKTAQEYFSDFEVDGIVDILRFNINSLLYKMDDPTDEIIIADKENKKIKTIIASRVYHVHLVLKYGLKPTKSNKNSRPKDKYRHFKIILNRDGIKNIIEEE